MTKGLSEVLCEACENVGYKNPTGIQAQSIPYALQGIKTERVACEKKA